MNELLNLENSTILNYMRAPLIGIYARDSSLISLEFEKKLCRSAFRKEFGTILAGQKAKIQTSFALFNKQPILDTLQWRRKKYSKLQKSEPLNKQLICCGIPILSANWILELIINQLQMQNRSVRSVINAQIRDVESLMTKLKSKCKIKGLHIIAKGRITKKKKAIAQKISRSIGTIPLGTFKQAIDYSQGIVSTKLGIIGLKVWVCY